MNSVEFKFKNVYLDLRRFNITCILTVCSTGIYHWEKKAYLLVNEFVMI